MAHRRGVGTVLIVQELEGVAALASVGHRVTCDHRGALRHRNRQGVAGGGKASPRAGAPPRSAELSVVRWRRRRQRGRPRRERRSSTVTQLLCLGGGGGDTGGGVCDGDGGTVAFDRAHAHRHLGSCVRIALPDGGVVEGSPYPEVGVHVGPGVVPGGI
eukprot:scaffold18403_cov48-Phaeocystis_antarctica.AAC.2